MRRLNPLILLAAALFAVVLWQQHASTPAGVGNPPEVAPTHQGTAASPDGFLPAEAQATLARIARGGPFEHSQDGAVFGNYEGRLPKQPRGFYHEYTVETPGAHNRGVRRIITGGEPPLAYYYTDDHYRSFRSFQVNR